MRSARMSANTTANGAPFASSNRRPAPEDEAPSAKRVKVTPQKPRCKACSAFLSQCSQCRNLGWFCAEENCPAQQDLELPLSLRASHVGCCNARESREECKDCNAPRPPKEFESATTTTEAPNKTSTPSESRTPQPSAESEDKPTTTITATIKTESLTFTLNPDQCRCDIDVLNTVDCWERHISANFCEHCSRSTCEKCTKHLYCHNEYMCGGPWSFCRDGCYEDFDDCPSCGDHMLCGGECGVVHPNSDGEWPKDSADEDSDEEGEEEEDD
ncbi:hypothetical protein QBC43DRAFT_349811 [Cladorrhinum sp. PSN259]|nr:hypothetical protein QBC43DRAFT_349811 [Cladorrhinum sp. PSN259]